MAMRSQPQGRVRFQSGLVPLFALVGNSRDVVTGAVPAAVATRPINAPSPSGASLQFNGTGGFHYGNTVARDLFYNRGPSSLLVEFYLPLVARTGSMSLIGKNDGGNATGWNLYIQPNNTVTFSITGSTNYYVLATLTAPAAKLVPGQRNTILIVFTGDLTSSTLATAYINGVFAGTNGGGAPTGTAGDANCPLLIGGADSNWGNAGFTGNISLIAAFRGQLAPVGKGGATPEGAVQALALHNNPWRVFSNGETGEAPAFTAAVVAPSILSGAAVAVASAYGSLSTGIKLSGAAVASATATGSLTAGAAGSLSMTVTPSTGAPYDLTALGTIDWINYPNASAVRKATGGSQINVSHVGSFSDSITNGSNNAVSWSDGSPTASGSSTNVIFSSNGEGVGYAVTFPADTTPRVATILGGIYGADMSVTATLSDGSAAQVSNSSGVTWSSGSGLQGAISITYKAASAGQTLTVKLLQKNANRASNYSNANIQAAILAPAAVAAQLSGSAAASASAGGALSTATPLSGAAQTAASGAGSLMTAIPLAGSASATAKATGSLVTSVKPSGAAASVATAGGTLSTAIPLSGSAQVVAVATGVLAGSGGGLSGAAVASATATGALTTKIALSGGAQAVAQAYGSLAGGGAALSGSAQASVTAGGALTTSIRLVGTATARATATGVLATAIPLAGPASASAAGSGALVTRIPLAGAAVAVAQASGDLTVNSAGIDISQISPARIVVFEGSGSRVVVFEGSGSRVVGIGSATST
ncbi:LamG-like jellyroll fold domain-containing protein [Massilia sp. 9096]|uniref:beta strand repeat-containing protein n=1 Tax=Massilia sp. 9096 TaxID=1500894 RepID=UPI000566F685|nr:LamG-like jellyroll fold domain-containing protein [Massilia sp. 9096]